MKNVKILQLADRVEWEAVYADEGLPSHSWMYAWGLAAAGYDPKLAVVDAGGARMLAPFFERSWRGYTDIATLPCLSGASLSEDSLAPLELWSEYATAQGWVCGYLQLAIQNHRLREQAPGRIRAHNAMFQFDLVTWDINTFVTRNTRKTITKFDRRGVTLILDKERLLMRFLELYYDDMDRRGEKAFFPPECLTRWFADDAVFAFGGALDNRIEAIHLARMHRGFAEAHLSANSETGRQLNAWLIWQEIEFFKSKGMKYLNIGGYGVAGDGLHWMKSRLNADEFLLLSVRQIYNQSIFDALCRNAGDALHEWRFPPYRV